MLFTTDKQTLDDLNIFGKHGGDSIFNIYNRTNTRGGAALLEEMFRYPLSDSEAINRRCSIIRHFSEKGTAFPFQSGLFDAAESYLDNKDERTKLTAQEQSIGKKLSNMIAVDAETAVIYKGISALATLLKETAVFIASPELNEAKGYCQEKNLIEGILTAPAFAPVLRYDGKPRLPHPVMAEYDTIFRFRHRDAVQKFLRYIYLLDVYLSVARVASERRFTFPVALPHGKVEVKLEGVYHPQIKDAVPNAVHITPDNNLLFLTGANMAGKSTFMKSLGIALFVAHAGFPVAAAKMEFSVLDGIYATINLPDNLVMGASHFYAEVLRVKKMALELSQGKNLFIVFDELFRGTNVKDAYEATIAITSAFAGKRNSLFVISTHIIEAGNVLRQQCDNIHFVYLPTGMNGNQPVYTYTLQTGITDDRHGMIIINNEKILEILKGGKGSVAQNSLTPAMPATDGRSFIADKQTLDDLNLLGKYAPYSIYGIFNKVKTPGGERLLEWMFRYPMTDVSGINQRSAILSYFQKRKLSFPFEPEFFRVVENYLGSGGPGNLPQAAFSVLRKKLSNSFLRDEEYSLLHAGLLAALEALNSLKELLKQLEDTASNPYREEAAKLRKILADRRLIWLEEERGAKKIPVIKLIKYDFLLRHTLQEEMEQVLNSIYHLDVYIAIGKVAAENRFSYATALPASRHLVKADGLWHPSLTKAVPNPVSLHSEQNVLFLTGANMAGKSTFMKSFGIALYLAHMGFPVAAREMQFSVKDGLYSSINVPDNLNLGYSHFFAEVLRVKKAAEEVSQGKNMVVIFDELFKGTNVKDAYDATLSVTAAFAEYRNCCFVISTHIIEAGQALRSYPNLQFSFLPTIMEGNMPRYPYTLREGISSDRHGMMIVEQERIPELLKG